MKWLCLFGHKVVPTGRRAIDLIEYECGRCGEILVGHREYSTKILFPADSITNELFNRAFEYRWKERHPLD